MRKLKEAANQLHQFFDVAFSFAGEQRDYVRSVRRALEGKDISVFFDEDYQVALWGKPLTEALLEIYCNRARAVVIFVSKEYVEKDWTRLEKRAALERAAREKTEFILPARFDNTNLPGLSSAVSYISLSNLTPEDFAELIIKKLGVSNTTQRTSDPLDSISQSTKDFAAKKKRREEVAQYIQSRGIDDVKAEVVSLFDLLSKSIDVLKRDLPNDPISCGGNRDNFIIRKSGRGSVSVCIHWKQQYSNMLENSEIRVVCYQGLVSIPGRNEACFPDPREIRRTAYLPSYVDDAWKWVQSATKSPSSTTELCSMIIKLFLELLEKYENSNIIDDL